MTSTVTKRQVKTYGPIPYKGYDETERWTIMAKVRYDDECGNGHNTFAITGEIRRNGRVHTCGSIHDHIAEYFPELKPYLKWHCMSSDGPLHYIDNTIYHAKGIKKDQGKWFVWLDVGNPKVNQLLGIYSTKEYGQLQNLLGAQHLRKEPYDNPLAKKPDLEAARSCAIWPDASLEQLQDKATLLERLPKLIQEFKRDVESLEFVF